jgi:hypothetical protein
MLPYPEVDAVPTIEELLPLFPSLAAAPPLTSAPTVTLRAVIPAVAR